MKNKKIWNYGASMWNVWVLFFYRVPSIIIIILVGTYCFDCSSLYYLDADSITNDFVQFFYRRCYVPTNFHRFLDALQGRVFSLDKNIDL